MDKVGIWTGMDFCVCWSDMAVQLKVSNSIVKLGARSLEKCFKPGTKIVQFFGDSTFLMNLNVMIL